MRSRCVDCGCLRDSLSDCTTKFYLGPNKEQGLIIWSLTFSLFQIAQVEVRVRYHVCDLLVRWNHCFQTNHILVVSCSGIERQQLKMKRFFLWEGKTSHNRLLKRKWWEWQDWRSQEFKMDTVRPNCLKTYGTLFIRSFNPQCLMAILDLQECTQNHSFVCRIAKYRRWVAILWFQTVFITWKTPF